jgi:hypothetical protein
VAESQDYNFTESEETKLDSSQSKVDEDAPVVFQLDKPGK